MSRAIAIALICAAACLSGLASSGDGSLQKKTAAGDGLEPSGFRGVSWGSTVAEADAVIHFGEHTCNEMSTREPEIWCGEDFAMGEVTATAQYQFAKGRLVGVMLSYDPSEFEYVRSVFIQKYGKPTAQEVVPMRTGMGVRYGNDTVSWRFPGVTIEMHRYGSTVNRGATFFTVNAWSKEKARRTASSKKAALSSLDGPSRNARPLEVDVPTAATVEIPRDVAALVAIGTHELDVLDILGDPKERRELIVNDQRVVDWIYERDGWVVRFDALGRVERVDRLVK